MTKLTNEQITTYVTKYINALSKIVEAEKKKILETEIDPSFPTDFPVKVTVLTVENGIILGYEKSESLSIEFIKERPKDRKLHGPYIPYKLLESRLDKAEKIARSDVDSLLAIPDKLKQQHLSKRLKIYSPIALLI